eukprot:11638382-Alexandrium_andersonii.AAC.1
MSTAVAMGRRQTAAYEICFRAFIGYGVCVFLAEGGVRPAGTVRIARQTSTTGTLVGVAIKLLARVPRT